MPSFRVVENLPYRWRVCFRMAGHSSAKNTLGPSYTRLLIDVDGWERETLKLVYIRKLVNANASTRGTTKKKHP